MGELTVTDLKKLSLTQLKELLQRQDDLLRKRGILCKLPDKGESVKVMRDKIQNEIVYREAMQAMENSFSNLTLTEATKDKHLVKICEMEKQPTRERFKPYNSLNKTVEIKPTKATTLIEIGNYSNKPTQLINLAESIKLLADQDERVKDEQVKVRLKREMDKLEAEFETDSEVTNDDEDEDDDFDGSTSDCSTEEN